MKKSYYFGIIAIFFATISNTYSSYNNTNLVNQIKTNPTISSKPTTSYIKLAYVDFIVGKNKSPKFTQRCYGGWVLVDGICTPKPCDGYPYGRWNPQRAMCSTLGDSCVSGDELKIKCKNCANNLSKDDEGGCYCNKSTYPFNDSDTPCGKYASFDVEADFCEFINTDNTRVKYYKGCVCPAGWERCDRSDLDGVGEACESYGKDWYSTCKCKDRYDELCEDANERPVGDGCTYNGITKYVSCLTCDPAKNEYHDLNEYWCDVDWIKIHTISKYYKQN